MQTSAVLMQVLFLVWVWSVDFALVWPAATHPAYAAGFAVLVGSGLLVPALRPRRPFRRSLLLGVPWLLLPGPAVVLSAAHYLHLFGNDQYEPGHSVAWFHGALVCGVGVVAGMVLGATVRHARLLAVASTLAWVAMAAWQAALMVSMLNGEFPRPGLTDFP